MREPTRVYLELPRGGYTRFMWFSEYAKNEMIMGCYGLSSKSPILSHEYPDRVVGSEEVKSVKFEYRDARHIGKPADHISIHRNGRFHVKLKQCQSVYIHRMQGEGSIDKSTGVFLDLRIFSDLPERYGNITHKPKRPYIVIPVGCNEVLLLSGFFSGCEYDLVTHVARVMTSLGEATPSGFPAIALNGRFLKGLLVPRTLSVSADHLLNKLRGTIVAFFFPLRGGKYQVKAIHFS